MIYVGRTGSGFSREDAVAICTKLRIIHTPVFSNPPKDPEARWTLPELVVVVKALEITRNKILKHSPSPVDNIPRMYLLVSLSGQESILWDFYRFAPGRK